jgi:hypothetical protein
MLEAPRELVRLRAGDSCEYCQLQGQAAKKMSNKIYYVNSRVDQSLPYWNSIERTTSS